jgi:uncharacterized protein YdeI (BOF family)
MRKTFLITAILLLSTAWAVAQTTPSSSQQPTTPSSPSSTVPSPQSSTPDASSTASQTSSQTSADNSTAIEGCLSGSSGSYTLTDQSGKAWQLAGDTSKLTEHVGHQVRIMGSNSDSSAASTGAGAAASAGSGSSSGAASTFTVKKVKMISASCPTSK